jgi:two-component system chemotaxis response regulator CheY
MGKKILFVDDSSTMRRLASMTAKEQGFECHEASSGEDALSVLKYDKFDMMIFDINMGGISGIELLELVKQDPTHKNTPVMMLTTESAQSVKDKARTLGAKGWITKPFQQSQLADVIKKLSNI